MRDVVVAGTVDELVGLSAYMDLRALNRLMQEGQTSSGAFLMVESPRIPELYAQLKQTPAISSVSIPEAALASFNDTIARTINVSTVVLIAFAVIIAFGMVYNGARIALSERGHELASLRVLGFTRGEIGFMLLGEQAILTLIAIPVGFALGYGIAGLITVAHRYRIDPISTFYQHQNLRFGFSGGSRISFSFGLPGAVASAASGSGRCLENAGVKCQ